MSDYDEYDDDLDSFEDDDGVDSSRGSRGDGPAELRRALKKAKRDLADAQKQLASERKSSRSRAVKEILSEKGLNPKIAAFIPSDVEATPEALTAWVGEFGDVFAPVGAGTPPDGEAAASEPFTEGEVDALDTLGRADTANPSLAGGDIESRMKAAGSIEELMEVIAQSGA